MKRIIVLDFGSQFAHLIGNRVRRLGAFSEVMPVQTSLSETDTSDIAGIILSGGPQSVFEDNSPHPDPKIYELGVPILGICYGHQLLAHHYKGTIKSVQKEFGKAECIHSGGELFTDIPQKSAVWMNHGDSVVDLPEGFEITAKTKDCPIAGFENADKKIYSVQFHPEVTHSEYGMQLLNNFVDICGATGSWSIDNIFDDVIEKIKEKAGDKNVFMLVSGGVDSSVAFALLTKALGKDRVYGLFVDHGLLRKNEADEVEAMLASAGFENLHVAREADYFFEKLTGLTEPEAKRKAIGNAFLDVQKKITTELDLNPDHWLLGQGTIYPDHIETGGSAHASTIKTHHNRVPEIEAMIQTGTIIEPLADFYKDEVRDLGRKIELPEKLVARHPFPGPGLGVRILCQQQADPLQNALQIETEIEQQTGFENRILPIRSVGVQGDARSYRHPVALFAADNYQAVAKQQSTLPNSFHDLNRVVVCLSHKAAPTKLLPAINTTITPERTKVLQEADAIVRQITEKYKLTEAVWQFPVVLAPIGSKPNTESIILRPIISENAMTATAVVFSDEILQEISDKILKITEISLVFLDITSKPPGTIEWE
jgi:GMP synthase (glutamine-hydrolysing)